MPGRTGACIQRTPNSVTPHFTPRVPAHMIAGLPISSCRILCRNSGKTQSLPFAAERMQRFPAFRLRARSDRMALTGKRSWCELAAATDRTKTDEIVTPLVKNETVPLETLERTRSEERRVGKEGREQGEASTRR